MLVTVRQFWGVHHNEAYCHLLGIRDRRCGLRWRGGRTRGTPASPSFPCGWWWRLFTFRTCAGARHGRHGLVDALHPVAW